MGHVESRWFGGLFKVLTMVIQVLMLAHLSTAIILAINPVFLHLEQFLNIPKGELLS